MAINMIASRFQKGIVTITDSVGSETNAELEEVPTLEPDTTRFFALVVPEAVLEFSG